MAIEHVDIADPDIHEPKGVASATAGDIYVADGAGSGAWKPHSWAYYGEMIINTGTTGVAVTAAADATLNTDSDYTKYNVDWASGTLDNITFSTDKLQVPIAGVYYLTFWCTIKIPNNNNYVGVKYSVNDSTPYSTRKIATRSTAANDYRSMSGHGVVTLAANDTVSLYIAGTVSDTPVITDGGLVIALVDTV